MRLWVDDEELNADAFDLTIQRDRPKPSVWPWEFVKPIRRVAWTISLKEIDASALLEAWGSPERSLTVEQGYHWSRAARLNSFLLRLLDPWGGHALLKTVALTVGGMRVVSMHRSDGIVTVELTNEPVDNP